MILKSDLETAALRGVAIGIARADDGEILYATPLLESMFGYTTRGSLTNGMHVDELVPLSVRGQHLHHRAAYAANPSTRPMGVGLNAHGLRADGSVFPVIVSLYSEVISNIVCVIFTVTDISGWGDLLKAAPTESTDPLSLTRFVEYGPPTPPASPPSSGDADETT